MPDDAIGSAMDLIEIVLRLGAAALVGGVIGLNRDLHHKPSGLRTLALVALGGAVVTMATAGMDDADAVSRVLQGVITGVGFVGAGVIVHEPQLSKVHGLTTAATIWVTACLGSVCGLGDWRLVAVACAWVGFVLAFGGRIERAVHARLGRDHVGEDCQPDRPPGERT